MVIYMEAKMKESKRRDSGGLLGSKSMARIKRNTRNLGGPVVPTKVGRATETKKEGAGFYLDCGGCGAIRNSTVTP
jgi:hypothetical protein